MLKPWQIVACVRHWLYNESASAISKVVGKSPTHVSDVFKSPAAHRLKAYLQERAGDPIQLAKDMIQASTLDVTMDWYVALDWAKKAQDYKAVHQMVKDLNAIAGLREESKAKNVPSQEIHIHLDGGSLTMPTVEATWEEVPDSR